MYAGTIMMSRSTESNPLKVYICSHLLCLVDVTIVETEATKCNTA